MNFSTVALFFVVFVAGTRGMKGIYNSAGSEEVANNTGLKALHPIIVEKLLAYVQGYAQFRSEIDNWNEEYLEVETPVGIVCLFTVRMDNISGEKGKIRVIKLEEWEREVSETTIYIEYEAKKFVYKDLQDAKAAKALEDAAMHAGKEFIQDKLTEDKEVQRRLRNRYQSVGYVHLPFSGYNKNEYIGDYMIFGALYSQVKGI